MLTSLPEISVLIARPHLASVAMLATALEMTLRSLSASYPDLAEDPEPTLKRSEEDAYVDAVLQQAQALQGLLRSYQGAVERHLRQRHPDDHPHQVPSF